MRKTSAGLLRNQVEADHMDRLAMTQDALTPKAAKALRAGKPRASWLTVRDN
jgi:hypothetical protein